MRSFPVLIFPFEDLFFLVEQMAYIFNILTIANNCICFMLVGSRHLIIHLHCLRLIFLLEEVKELW